METKEKQLVISEMFCFRRLELICNWKQMEASGQLISLADGLLCFVCYFGRLSWSKFYYCFHCCSDQDFFNQYQPYYFECLGLKSHWNLERLTCHKLRGYAEPCCPQDSL